MKVKLFPGAKAPVQSTIQSAGYDLFVHTKVPIVIEPRVITKIPTGVCMEIPMGWTGLLMPRSSATLKNLRICNVIDADYRGEVSILVANMGYDRPKVANGDRIAQIVIVPCHNGVVEVVDELTPTRRGGSGFGSTGQ